MNELLQNHISFCRRYQSHDILNISKFSDIPVHISNKHLPAFSSRQPSVPSPVPLDDAWPLPGGAPVPYGRLRVQLSVLSRLSVALLAAAGAAQVPLSSGTLPGAA